MGTTAHRMTADEFAGYAATHGRCELVRGEVRELAPSGARHGIITGRLHHFISRHVYDHGLGEVFAAEVGFRLGEADEPTVRAPDIAFIARERVPAADTPGFAPIPPDLVVETLSPDDRASDVSEKVQWWLKHGVRLVWVVDPENQSVTVHHPDGQAQRLPRGDALDGGEVVPGFALPLRKLFE